MLGRAQELARWRNSPFGDSWEGLGCFGTFKNRRGKKKRDGGRGYRKRYSRRICAQERSCVCCLDFFFFSKNPNGRHGRKGGRRGHIKIAKTIPPLNTYTDNTDASWKQSNVTHSRLIFSKQQTCGQVAEPVLQHDGAFHHQR